MTCCSRLTFLILQFAVIQCCWTQQLLPANYGIHFWRTWMLVFPSVEERGRHFLRLPAGSLGLWEGVLHLGVLCSFPKPSACSCSWPWRHVPGPSRVLCSACLCLLSFLLPFNDQAQSFPLNMQVNLSYLKISWRCSGNFNSIYVVICLNVIMKVTTGGFYFLYSTRNTVWTLLLCVPYIPLVCFFFLFWSHFFIAVLNELSIECIQNSPLFRDWPWALYT